MLLTEELRVIGLVLPLAIVTALLVVYVGWRTRLLTRLRDGRHEHRKAA